MSAFHIANRYAKSLLDLAAEQDKLERIKEDVDSFQQVTDNRDFYLMLKSPIISHDKKKTIFQELFDGHYDELTKAFLNILADKGREAYLPEIAKAFQQQYKQYRHISTVKVTSAVPLDDETLQKIKRVLLDSSITDDKVEISTEVKPDLIGGFIVEVDNNIYDASVAQKLEAFKREFRTNEYISQIIAH